MKDNKELILSLSNAFGPSGNEDDVIEILKEELKDRMNLHESHVRDLYGEYKKSLSGKTVLLDAHIDEVGFMVQAIRPSGMIEFLTLGSFQVNTLPGTMVQIRNDLGEEVTGIISSIPPHYLSGPQTGAITVDQLTIDIGARSKEEATEKFHISVGNFGCPKVINYYDEKNDLFFGKAFDCRIGVAAMTTVLKELELDKVNVNVKAAYTSQEEVGERGAISASKEMKPDLVICFEGCPADDSFTPEYKIQTGLKRGPMIRHMDRSIICNPRFMAFTKKLAALHKLDLQCAVRTGGGNNGAIYQGDGAPSIVVGIPVRYIHTANCITTYYDFEAGVKLVKEILYALTDEIIEGF